MKTLLTALVLSTSTAALALEKPLYWDIPNQREDGSELPIEQIENYTLYQDGNPIQFLEPTQTSTVVSVEEAGNYCFTISTTDTDEVEGFKSPELCLDFFPAPPAAPALRSSL